MIIPFPREDAPPEPGPDGLYRDCVIRLPHLDRFGRSIYVAVDGEGREISRGLIGPKTTVDETARVQHGLWERVQAARKPHLSLL